jgi:hypothetical protein
VNDGNVFRGSECYEQHEAPAGLRTRACAKILKTCGMGPSFNEDIDSFRVCASIHET